MSLRLTYLFLIFTFLLSGCADSGPATVPTVTTVVPTPTEDDIDVPTATVVATSTEAESAENNVPTATAVTETASESESEMVTATAVTTDPVWATRAPLLEPNSETAVAQLGDQIYVIGGYPSSRTTVRTVQVYDAATDSWSLAVPLPGPVNHAMAAAVKGKVYLIGGQSGASGGGPFLDAVFEYDPASDRWTTKALMPTARSGGTAVVIDDKIYVAGGRPPHGQDFAVYDPAADSWEILPNMPTGRNHLAGAAIGGKMYVVGGRFGAGFQSDMTDALEVFDPATNSWTTRASMPTVRGGLNAAVANGCLHLFGGEGSGGVFPQHEVYDPTTDTWKALPAMPRPVHGVTGAAVIDDWIHLPGGGTAVGGSSGSTIHQVVQATMRCG
jgi:N-acetylneuraminic acid mutarotase